MYRRRTAGTRSAAILSLALVAGTIALCVALDASRATAPAGQVAAVVAGRGSVTLAGRVVGGRDAPAEGVVLRLWQHRAGTPREVVAVPLPAGGRFRIEGLEAGIHHVIATSASGVCARTLAVRGRGVAGPLVLALEPGARVRGTVGARQAEPVRARLTLEREPRPGDPARVAPWFPPLDVVTDAEGRFDVGGLPPGPLRLTVSAPGHVTRTLERLEPGPGDVDVTLVAEAGLRVRVVGEGVDGQRSAVAGARVRLFAPGSVPIPEAVTDGDGEVVFSGLEPGTWAVDARSADLLAWRPEEVVLGEGDRREMTIVLRPGLAIEGTVRDADTGAPVEGACIVASRRSTDSRLACASSDPLGRFRIAALVPGKYALVVQSPGFLRARLPLVHVKGEGTGEPIAIALSRSLRVTGTVSDAEGAPVPGARVMIDDEQKLSSGLLEGLVDLHLPSLMPEGPGVIPVGDLGVTVGPVPPLPLDPTPGTRAAGGGPEELPPGCGCLDEQGRLPGTSGLSAADGSFFLDGISPGEIRLVVVHPDHATLRSGAIVVEPTGDPEPIALVLEKGGTLGGRVLDADGRPLPDALVWIDGHSAAFSMPVEVQDDGGWQVQHVAGDVVVTASCEGHVTSSREVTLAAGTSSLAVDFLLEPEGETMRVRILDAWDYPVPGALVVVRGVGAAPGSRVTVRSDSDGVVEFPAPPADRWRFEVGHPSWRTLEVTLAPWNPWEEPVLVMGFAAGVSGKVMSDWSRLPVEEFTVTILVGGDEVERRTFGSGSFEITDLSPGPCRVLVEADGYEPAHEDVDLPGGEGPGDVTLPDLAFWLDPADPLG